MTQEMNLNDLIDASGEIEDQTVETAGGDFDNVPPAGVTVARLVSYIDLGKHDGGSFQGKKKPDSDKVRIEFELLGPDNWIEWEKDGVKHKSGQLMSVTIKKSTSDKSAFRKLFKKLAYGREDKDHMAKMLGEAFVVTVHHNEVEKDGKKRTYANLNLDGEWSVQAPFAVDPLTKNKQFYDVPAATVGLKLFIWNKPLQWSWDSLFIDGTREVEKDGVKTQVSKNWLQELIMSAKNFHGSPIHALLNGVANLPGTEAAAQAQQSAQQQPAVQQQQVAQQPVEQPVTQQAVTQATADPLAALGFK